MRATHARIIGGRRRAYTLIELVVLITVTGVLAAIGSAFLLQGLKAWQNYQFLTDTAEQARAGMDWMVREVRETDVDSLGAPIIATASATSYSFTHYLEVGGNESVAFSWGGVAGNPLTRNAQTLVPKVNSLVFTYYDKNDAALSSLPLSATDREAVRRVVITMTVKHDVYNFTKKIRGEAILRAPYN